MKVRWRVFEAAYGGVEMRPIFNLVTLSLLCACATQAQRQSKNIRDAVVQAKNEVVSCNKLVDADPKFSTVVVNAAANGLPTLQQLSNQNVPGPAEGNLIIAWRQARDNCAQQPLMEVAGVAPAISQVLQANIARLDDVFLDLSKGKYSWGQAMALVKKDTLEASAKVTELASQMNSELAAENQEELDRRAAAAAAFGQAMQQASQNIQQQQIINQQQQLINRSYMPQPIAPIHTTCNQMGTFTNCTSQ
jgi:hypothetical protein